MAISISSYKNRGNTVFDTLPDDAIRSIFEFLKGKNGALSFWSDDRAVILTSIICQNWRNNGLLREEERRESPFRLHYCIRLHNVQLQIKSEHGYPVFLSKLFHAFRLPLWRMPLLDLGDRGSGYFTMRSEEMDHSVMRIRDIRGRSGIALKIQASRILAIRNEIAERSLDMHRLLYNWEQNKQTVLCLYQRYSPSSAYNTWVFTWGEKSDVVRELFKFRCTPNREYPLIVDSTSGPFCIGDMKVFRNLLANQDPDFTLSGHPKGYSGRVVLVTALALLAMGCLLGTYLISNRNTL